MTTDDISSCHQSRAPNRFLATPMKMERGSIEPTTQMLFVVEEYTQGAGLLHLDMTLRRYPNIRSKSASLHFKIWL